MKLCVNAKLLGNALDASVNAVVKNSARRSWRTERLLNPENKGSYAQALFHCATAFYSVKYVYCNTTKHINIHVLTY